MTEVAAALKLPKPTVFRILHVLESRAYVHRTDGGRFRLTAKLGHSSAPHQMMECLLAAAKPVMERLVEVHQETANMAILDGSELVVVHAIESPRAIRMSSKAGNRRHVHSTALGKVLIAWREPKEVARLLRVTGMPALTEKTITTSEELERELALVRKRGYAEDNEENEMGGRCVAAPVRDREGTVIAAVSVSGPLNRMTAANVRAIARDVERGAEEIGEAL